MCPLELKLISRALAEREPTRLIDAISVCERSPHYRSLVSLVAKARHVLKEQSEAFATLRSVVRCCDVGALDAFSHRYDECLALDVRRVVENIRRLLLSGSDVPTELIDYSMSLPHRTGSSPQDRLRKGDISQLCAELTMRSEARERDGLSREEAGRRLQLVRGAIHSIYEGVAVAGAMARHCEDESSSSQKYSFEAEEQDVERFAAEAVRADTVLRRLAEHDASRACRHRERRDAAASWGRDDLYIPHGAPTPPRDLDAFPEPIDAISPVPRPSLQSIVKGSSSRTPQGAASQWTQRIELEEAECRRGLVVDVWALGLFDLLSKSTATFRKIERKQRCEGDADVCRGHVESVEAALRHALVEVLEATTR
eukprot:PhM_4_TR16143/c0_g1_i3/m.21007